MAEGSLLYRSGPTKIDTITLDIIKQETHGGKVTVTKHPVEKGFDVTDHARPEPDELTLECMVSNTPLNLTQQRRTVDVKINDKTVKLQTSALEDQVQGVAGYAEDAYAKLRDLKDNPKLIRVVTGLRTYDNMILDSHNIPRDAKTGDGLVFTAHFVEVRIISNKSTTTTVAKEPKAKKKVSTGKQTAKTSDKGTENKSIALSAAEAIWGPISSTPVQ